MICYEIWLNGERLCECGHKNMFTLQASIFCTENMETPNMTISALLKTTDILKNNAKWASRKIKIGDEVNIKIVECSNPDDPEITTSFGTRLHPSSKKELFCSFCGRSENEVPKMVEGMGGNICIECARVCLEEP